MIRHRVKGSLGVKPYGVISASILVRPGPIVYIPPPSPFMHARAPTSYARSKRRDPTFPHVLDILQHPFP